MTVAEITGLLLAVGAGPVILKTIDWAKAAKSGRAQAEKAQNRNALGRLIAAEDRAEEESTYRRLIAEHASILRRLLIEWGYPEDKLPDWPKRPTKETVQ